MPAPWTKSINRKYVDGQDEDCDTVLIGNSTNFQADYDKSRTNIVSGVEDFLWQVKRQVERTFVSLLHSTLGDPNLIFLNWKIR